MAGTIVNRSGENTNPATDGAVLSIVDALSAPTSLEGGQIENIGTDAIPLTETSTACLKVWVGAPYKSDGSADNSEAVIIGDLISQNIPVFPSNYEGFFIPIDDASKLYIKSLSGTQKLNYRIFA